MTRLFFVLFGVVGVGILLKLGFWQLDRLEWKTTLLAEIDSRMSQDPVALEGRTPLPRDNFKRVLFKGELSGPTAHVLTSERNLGPGYKVIAAVSSADHKLMVDLGFVTVGEKSAFEEMSGPVEIVGNVYFPNEVDPAYTPEPDFEGNIFFARELDVMPDYLGTKPALIVATSITPPLGTLPLRVAHNLPNDHLQYAITWFLLAVVWSAMTIYALIRTPSRPSQPKE